MTKPPTPPTKTKTELRNRFNTNLLFSQLQFLNYQVKKNVLVLNYQIGEIQFQHQDEFSIDLSSYASSSTFDKLALFYGIAKAFKYSQHFLCADLVVHHSSLTDQEELFWQNYFDRYSLELFFTEKISLDYLTKLKFLKNDSAYFSNNSQPSFARPVKEDVVLMGVGGSKDAIYAYELLEQSDIPTDLFFSYETETDLKLRLPLTQMMANKYQRTFYTVKRVEAEPAEVKSAIKIQRQAGIKPSAPAASVNAIRLAIIAYCEGYDFVTTCNEKSADFGNDFYFDQEVNHQYSKSLEFEKSFADITKSFFPTLSYFSILKPLYEISIAKGFATLKEYHQHFNSCNRNHRTWCLDCSKCAFVFTLLAGFLNHQDLMAIFGENLFDKKSLAPTFLELMGLAGFKPLECVGEKEEMWIAMARALRLGHRGQALDIFQDNILPSISIDILESKYFKIYLDKNSHNIPQQIIEKLKWL